MTAPAAAGAAPSRDPRVRYWDERPDALDWITAGDARPEAWRSAHETFLSPDTVEALDLLGDLRGARVLELGCGPGHGSAHLLSRGARVVGVDLSPRRCAAARDAVACTGAAAGWADFVAADGERLPFADGAFDAVFARDVLMYAAPEVIADECARLLRPGGRVGFVEALDANPLARLHRSIVRGRGRATYRSFTRHLGWDELARLGGPQLRPVATRASYLAGAAAFGVLFVTGSSGAFRRLLAATGPLDRWLLRRVPALRRYAWRGAAIYRRPADDGDA